MSGSPAGTNVAAARRWQPARHATDRSSLSRRGRLRRRGGRLGLGSGPARRHRRAALHELRAEHAVVRMARAAGRGRLPGPVRLLREQHAQGLPDRQPARAPNSGSNWANWSGVATLQHGGQYGVCAQGQYSFPNDSLFFPDGPNSCSMGTMLGRRAYTTIDRSKPTAAAAARGRRDVRQGHEDPGADRLRRRRRRPVPRELPLLPGRRRAEQPVRHERRQDLRLQRGVLGPRRAPASRPRSPAPPTTAQIPDGNVWACVIAADASIPDNPNGPNQSATADKANLSAPELRRRRASTARRPTVAIGVASAAVKVGDLVSLQATASDATVGPGRRRPVDVGRQHRRAGAATPSRTPTRSPAPTRSR